MNEDTQQVASSLTDPQLNAMAHIAEYGGSAGLDGRTVRSLLRKGLVIELEAEGAFCVTEAGLALLDPEEKPSEEAPTTPSPPEPDNLEYVPEYATKSPQHARMVKLARDFHKNDGHSAEMIVGQIAGRCSTIGITAPSLEMVESWLA